jgi:hypothetical protein
MMTPIFAFTFAALLLAWLGRGRLALGALLVMLALSIGLFLFEVHNRDYGFRMPWIQTSAPVTAGEG